MRADYLDRFALHFGEEGFRRLMRTSVLYEKARHTHAITETAPGHATLFTGAEPRIHGIIGNSWLDEEGRDVASVLDTEHWLLAPGLPAGQLVGRSPHRLEVPTVGDALLQATAGRARVVGVSLKDRGAILPAGRGGTAFWWGSEGFVTSTYYFEESPPWLAAHQKEHPLGGYLTQAWSLALPEDQYFLPPSLRREGHEALWGEGFPHRASEGASPSSLLKTSPFGDVAVFDLARRVLREFELGADEVPDLLSISLSATDYIGHFYGPRSREMEDQLVRLDAELARFLHFVDELVGEEVLVVLSADHGVEDSPEAWQEAGLRGGRLTEDAVAAVVKSALTEEYGSARYFQSVASPYVYLDRAGVEGSGRSLAEVRRTVAKALSGVELIFWARPVDELAGITEVEQQVARSVEESRGGDVYVVPKPGVHFVQEASLFATHGTPWARDQHVPLLFSSPDIQPARVLRPVDVRSVAATVSDLLGIEAPAAHQGEALVEVRESFAVRDLQRRKRARTK